MSAPILEVRDVTVRRGAVQVLEVPALALKRGSVTALIGPNGSGKSTLLQTLASLLQPVSGTLAFEGTPLRSRADRHAYRRKVSLVFQEPLLFDATVHGNLASGLKLHGVPRPEREARIEETARLFGIGHLLDRSARKLSGGEAQRTSLARAFALRPEILFLDEPFSALDPPTREALIDDLGQVLKRTRTTALMATHDQMEALRLADGLVVMAQGRIAQTGKCEEVINHPADEFVASFVGMETVLEGRVLESREGMLLLDAGGLQVECLGEAAPGEVVLVGVRPENVTLHAPGEAAASSARNRFPGTVTRLLPKGPYFKAELDCGIFLTAFVTHRSLEELGLREGAPVLASFKATAVHLIRK